MAHLLRYGDLIKDVEQLETMTEMTTLEAPVQDLATKLYSILSSYLQGPALQVVRAHSDQRNGFAAWHRLKHLYAPRARPRALAIGQAIMQHPSFSTQWSMLENLLHFDALLDQYELAAGHRLPDDLTVSTVMRCLDGPTRRHLELVMDEGMDIPKLKDKLILLDKNTKVWSGDTFERTCRSSISLQPRALPTIRVQPPWKWTRCTMGVKAKARTRANRKARKGVGLVFPMEGNIPAKVEARENQRAKERKVAKERTKESIRKGQ